MKTEEETSRNSYSLVNRNRRLVYAFLSRIYEREITEEFLRELSSENSPIRQLGAPQELEDKTFREGFETISRYLRDMDTRNLNEVKIELAVEYANLFLCVKEKPLHPSESAYRSEDHAIYQEHRDEALREYWNAGVDKVKGFTEPEDHIAIELQFMAYLCRRTVEALEKNEKDEAKRYLQTQIDFIDNHLAKWVPELTKDILENATVNFYKGIALVTNAFIESDRKVMRDLIEENSLT
jgi:TorA maturation chaperone TorD